MDNAVEETPIGRGIPTKMTPRPTQTPNTKRTIQDALDSQVNSLTGLHEAIDFLEKRLEPILSPETAGESLGQDKLAAVSIMSRVDDNSGAIKYAKNRLRALIDRLEV